MRDIKKLMLKEDFHHLATHYNLVTSDRSAVWQRYCKEFQAGMDGEEVPHRKANAGRKAANLWLLKAARIK